MAKLRFRLGSAEVRALSLCLVLATACGACSDSTEAGGPGGAAGASSTATGGVGSGAGGSTSGAGGNATGDGATSSGSGGSSATASGSSTGGSSATGGAGNGGTAGASSGGGAGREDGGMDAHASDASSDAGSSCGGATCAADQFCVHPSTNQCGPAPECVAMSDAGACPTGTMFSQFCIGRSGGGCIAIPMRPPPHCATLANTCNANATQCSCLGASACGSGADACQRVDGRDVYCVCLAP